MDYLHLGRIVAVTLLQGGPGLPVLQPPVAEYILTGRITNLTEHDFPIEIQPVVAKASSYCVCKLCNINMLVSVVDKRSHSNVLFLRMNT